MGRAATSGRRRSQPALELAWECPSCGSDTSDVDVNCAACQITADEARERDERRYFLLRLEEGADAAEASWLESEGTEEERIGLIVWRGTLAQDPSERMVAVADQHRHRDAWSRATLDRWHSDRHPDRPISRSVEMMFCDPRDYDGDEWWPWFDEDEGPGMWVTYPLTENIVVDPQYL